MSTSAPRKSDARQRILETAERLFYADGIHSVGIDRIIAEAGVAKMTLYNHFASKDDLILEVLRYREVKFNEMFEGFINQYREEGMSPVEALFAALKKWFESSVFRGCAFINTTVELADHQHHAVQYSAEHKLSFRNLVRDLLIEEGGRPAAVHAGAIYLLIEGAIVSAQIHQNSEFADISREAAFTLMRSEKQK
jgi:AcrR family transcriptional regulator